MRPEFERIISWVLGSRFRPVLKDHSQLPEKDLATLRQEYDSVVYAAAVERSGRLGPGTHLQDVLKETEEKIIQKMPEEFMRQFLRIYCSCGFDLRDILEAYDRGDWIQPVRVSIKQMISIAGGDHVGRSYLRRERQSGEISQVPLPFTGKEMLLWLFQLAKEGSQSRDDIVGATLDQLRRSLEDDVLCDKTFAQLGIDKKEAGDAVFNTGMLVIIGQECARQFKLFAEVVTKVPGGGAWVRKMIEELGPASDQEMAVQQKVLEAKIRESLL